MPLVFGVGDGVLDVPARLLAAKIQTRDVEDAVPYKE